MKKYIISPIFRRYCLFHYTTTKESLKKSLSIKKKNKK